MITSVEMWKIDESPEIVMQLTKAPQKVQEKYLLWKSFATASGPFLPGKGWGTEKLSGPFKRFYSIRLNKKWRAIYEVHGTVKIIAILCITPHIYKKVRRFL